MPVRDAMSSGVVFIARSDLFSKMIAFLSSKSFRISSSSSFSSSEESTTYKIKSASPASVRAFSTPIFSILSSVSRIPAVSMRRRPRSLRRTDSSSTSLVVPATSVTIARSCPERRLRREDLPAFGLPRMTVRMPSERILPESKVRIISSISLRMGTRLA